MGDIDYGLRAVKHGYALLEHPVPVGFQENNEGWAQSVSYLNWGNWRYILRSPKGIRVGEWLHFCREYGGWLWPANFIWRYIKLMIVGQKRPPGVATLRQNCPLVFLPPPRPVPDQCRVLGREPCHGTMVAFG